MASCRMLNCTWMNGWITSQTNNEWKNICLLMVRTEVCARCWASVSFSSRWISPLYHSLHLWRWRYQAGRGWTAWTGPIWYAGEFPCCQTWQRFLDISFRYLSHCTSAGHRYAITRKVIRLARGLCKISLRHVRRSTCEVQLVKWIAILLPSNQKSKYSLKRCRQDILIKKKVWSAPAPQTFVDNVRNTGEWLNHL